MVLNNKENLSLKQGNLDFKLDLNLATSVIATSLFVKDLFFLYKYFVNVMNLLRL